MPRCRGLTSPPIAGRSRPPAARASYRPTAGTGLRTPPSGASSHKWTARPLLRGLVAAIVDRPGEEDGSEEEPDVEEHRRPRLAADEQHHVADQAHGRAQEERCSPKAKREDHGGQAGADRRRARCRATSSTAPTRNSPPASRPYARNTERSEIGSVPAGTPRRPPRAQYRCMSEERRPGRGRGGHASDDRRRGHPPMLRRCAHGAAAHPGALVAHELASPLTTGGDSSRSSSTTPEPTLATR